MSLLIFFDKIVCYDRVDMFSLNAEIATSNWSLYHEVSQLTKYDFMMNVFLKNRTLCNALTTRLHISLFRDILSSLKKVPSKHAHADAIQQLSRFQ